MRFDKSVETVQEVLQEQPTQLFWNLIREECEYNRALKGLHHKHTNECQIFQKVSAVLNGATNEPELKGPKQKKIKTAILDTQQHPYTLNLSNCTGITINYS